ncbi:MAG: hypothetical protein K2M97_03365 [Muribaculaceae bacterium]|nr:hypothetical protein [Muribaculaceae bacterium]
MKILIYALLVFGTICETAGVFIIIDALIYGSAHLGLGWVPGLLTCLLGSANVIVFKLLQLRYFPPQR